MQVQGARSYQRVGRFYVAPLAVIIASIFAGAVGTPPAGAQPAEAPVYTIRAGDTLDIVVTGHEEWSLNVTVRPDGRVSYPGIGEIEVAGTTVQQLTDQIEHELGPGGRHLRNPQVHINVSALRLPTAYVLGAVNQPGAVELPRGISPAPQVLTMAGGAVPEGDITAVTLYREDGTSRVIDLDAELNGRAEPTMIRAGDVLMVPEAEVRFVGVLGEVGSPGEVALPRSAASIDLLSLLVEAGDLDPQADRDRAMILRKDGPVEVVSIDRVLSREVPSPTLSGGDVLWVPALPPEPEMQYFAVTGAVTSGGRFEYREGITLGDALALAGRLQEAANPEEVAIIHPDGDKETLDISPMLSGEETAIARTPIQPEDLIIVPAYDKSYVVLGAVESTGFFTWDEDARLADALVEAGGLAKDAAARRAMLIRRDEDGRSPTVLEFDAQSLLKGENEAANWTLMAGDTIYVPHAERGGVGDRLSDPLSLLGIVGALGRLLDW